MHLSPAMNLYLFITALSKAGLSPSIQTDFYIHWAHCPTSHLVSRGHGEACSASWISLRRVDQQDSK